MESYYDDKTVRSIGLERVGKNVKISKLTSFYGRDKISIGDNVRIDDFCLLSGRIAIGNNVHIAAGCYIYGGEIGVEIEDFVGLSSRVVVYAVSDDYSGEALTNPTIPDEFRKVITQKVVFKKHSIVGTTSVILPGVILEEGCAIGALSLVTKSLPAWTICMGYPAKVVGERSKKILELESEYKLKYS